MSEKVYTLTVEYGDDRSYKDDVIDAEGTLDHGLTWTEAFLRSFIARIKELDVSGPGNTCTAKVKSVVAQ